MKPALRSFPTHEQLLITGTSMTAWHLQCQPPVPRTVAHFKTRSRQQVADHSPLQPPTHGAITPAVARQKPPLTAAQRLHGPHAPVQRPRQQPLPGPPDPARLKPGSS